MKMKLSVFPTKMGGYFIGLIFLIYILAIGYSNNLLLIFCLVLFSLNFIWFLSTVRFAMNLKIHSSFIKSNYAGEDFEINLDLSEELDINHEINLCYIASSGFKGHVKFQNQEAKRIRGKISIPVRGVYHWETQVIKTTAPLGLYEVTRRLSIDHTTYAYPSLTSNFELQPSEVQGDGIELMNGQGSGDFFGLNTYDNESARKISWKHYAQTGELFLKEFENNKTAKIFIELKLPDQNSLKEDYLSKISSQLTEANRMNIPFEFKGQETKTSQLTEALKELASC